MGTLAQKACNGLIEIGATPDALVELRNWNYDEQGETIDFSTMGDCSTTTKAGRVTRRVEMGCYFARPVDAAQAQLVVGAEDLAIVVYPFGKVDGYPKRSGTINVLGRTESGDVDGGVELQITAESNGELTLGTYSAP
jgi:hypothetical protein